MIAKVSCVGGLIEYRLERTWDGMVTVDSWVRTERDGNATFDSHLGVYPDFRAAMMEVSNRIEKT